MKCPPSSLKFLLPKFSPDAIDRVGPDWSGDIDSTAIYLPTLLGWVPTVRRTNFS